MGATLLLHDPAVLRHETPAKHPEQPERVRRAWARLENSGPAWCLATLGVTLLAPHRSNRVQPPRHDGRTAKRLKKRHVVEWSFASLQAFCRLPIRHQRWSFIYAGFVALACLIIVARTL